VTKRIARAAIDAFLQQRRLAVVGVSRGGKKFGNTILKELSSKNYELFPVNPNTDRIEGRPCYPDLSMLGGKVDGAVVVVPPAQAERVVRQAADAGIRYVWLQQGAESDDAIRAGEERGIEVIHGECILMYAEPAAWIHRAHRWLRGLFGRMPQ